MPDIAVVDYGMGNLRSVAKALHHVAPDREIVVSADPAVIRAARRVVLPGQSAMPDCIRCLDDTGLQMLFDESEEGPTATLGVVVGRVVRFRDGDMLSAAGERLKVPHMGWSPVRQARPHPLWTGIAEATRFYFAHSYYPAPADPQVRAGMAAYPTPFTCAIAQANIFAVQFHPEKSHRAGLQLLANFIAWDGRA